MSAYLLANRTMPWWAMGLSIMATQASGITFIGTTGQAYVDGMQFVQFYFGLPLAMVILSATLVPLFRRSGAYTAYEYLETRFDGKTRTLTCIVFLIQRGLGVGLALYAPAIVLSVMLGWSERWTIMIMGVLDGLAHHIWRHEGHHVDRRSADGHHLSRDWSFSR